MNEPIQSLRWEMGGSCLDSTMLQLVELVQKEVEVASRKY